MAHDIQKCARTKDVLSNIDVLFENDVLIEKPIRQGLQENGFVKESPIQMAAFPYVLNGYGEWVF
jgi:Superfamily II DNA and RNA helicases